MARIRSIKPEIAQDAKLASVSRVTRYHFVLLWTVADDEGFFRANTRSLIGQCYPHDEDVTEADVRDMNAALHELGVIDLLVTPDGPIGLVCNWRKHQRIDRPSKSHLGEIFARYSRVPREGAAHGVLSPESLPVLVDDSAADETDEPVTEPTLTAMYLSIWANGAVAEKWGERPSPYTIGQCAAMADALLASGVEWQVARDSIYRQCRESKAAVPPRGPTYFRPGIETHWEQEQARRALAKNLGRPPREASPSPDAGARREHWSDKKAREESEEGTRNLVKLRFGNVEQRRAQLDGPEWWARMQYEAKQGRANVVLYAYDHMHEAAEAVAHA